MSRHAAGRRLRAVRLHLCSGMTSSSSSRHHHHVIMPGAAAGATRSPGSLHLAEQLQLPEQLEQADDGFLVQRDVAMLEALEDAAVSRRDYRLAAILRDTLDVLTPRSTPLTLADVAFEDPLATLSCFWENGFAVLHGLLEGADLERARGAWLRAEPQFRSAFLASATSDVRGDIGNKFTYGIPNLMELDDVFIGLADHPKLVAVVQHLAGAGGLDDDGPTATPPTDRRYHGTMRVSAMAGNIVTTEAADGTRNRLGYTMWHHDHPTPTDCCLPSQRTVKCFVALWDISPDGGCTALVPQTHRLPGCFLPGSQMGAKLLRRGFATHAERHDAEGATNGPDALPQESMPNHVKMALPAGSAFIFDSSVWHTCEFYSGIAHSTAARRHLLRPLHYLCSLNGLCLSALPNTSGEDRRTAHFAYSSSSLSSAPVWGPAAGISVSTLQRLALEGKLPISRRRILGLPDNGTS